MFIRPIFLATMAATLCLALPAVSQDIDGDTVVASVNGTDITLGHIIVMRDSLPVQYDNLEDDVLFNGLVDQAVQQLVLAQTISEPSRAIKLRLENERWTLLAGTAMNIEIAKSVTEEALQEAYDKKYADIEPAREYNASHILVETEESAKALIAELDGGADFADLARENSTGPSGPNGGELGWFGIGMMVPAFEEAVLLLDVGQVSAPVETQFGWHVIILNDSRLKDAPTIDEVRDDLTEELRQKVIEDILASLTESSDVVRPDLSGIDPAIMRDVSLVQE